VWLYSESFCAAIAPEFEDRVGSISALHRSVFRRLDVLSVLPGFKRQRVDVKQITNPFPRKPCRLGFGMLCSISWFVLSSEIFRSCNRLRTAMLSPSRFWQDSPSLLLWFRSRLSHISFLYPNGILTQFLEVLSVLSGPT
jgi:hypothetical protein